MISSKAGYRASVLTAPRGANCKNFNINRSRKFDRDADQWIRRRRIKNLTQARLINRYVTEIKKIGMWDNGLISYPLRFLQNSQGLVVHALSNSGNYEGSLTGAVASLRTGLLFSNNTQQKVTFNHAFPHEESFYFCVALKANAAGEAYPIADANSSVFVGFPAGQNPQQASFILNENNDGDTKFSLDVGAPYDSYKFMQFYYEGPDAECGGKINNGQITTSATSATSINQPGNINLSRTGANNGFLGEISFFATSQIVPTVNQMESMFNIYKSTLGQGLGLP